MVLEPGKSMIKYIDQYIRCLVRTSFLVHRWFSSGYVLIWLRGEGALWGPFARAPKPS